MHDPIFVCVNECAFTYLCVESVAFLDIGRDIIDGDTILDEPSENLLELLAHGR